MAWDCGWPRASCRFRRGQPTSRRAVASNSTASTIDAVMANAQRTPPLSPQQFHILLALADEDRHGYGIILEVAERTGGAVRLGTGPLYTAIGRLAGNGLIEETSRRDRDDERRRYYRLTAAGRE